MKGDKRCLQACPLYIYCLILLAGEFTSLLHACVEVIDFLLWHANVILFSTHVLKREMKPTKVHRIYLTKEQRLQGGQLVG
jgi:hypothetical protein